MTALRDRMIGDMKLAGLSVRTQQAYTQAVKRLATFYRRRPDQLSEEDVRAFLVHEIDGGIARGTFKRVHFGLEFFFVTTLGRDWPLFSKKNRIRQPKQKRLPEALSDGQVRRLLGCVRRPRHRTCLLLMYGCGLRIGEAVRLEVADIDSEQGVVRITAGPLSLTRGRQGSPRLAAATDSREASAAVARPSASALAVSQP